MIHTFRCEDILIDERFGHFSLILERSLVIILVIILLKLIHIFISYLIKTTG